MTTVGAVLAAVLAAAFLATVLGLAGIFWCWRGCSPWRGCPREPATLRADGRSRATGAERPAGTGGSPGGAACQRDGVFTIRWFRSGRIKLAGVDLSNGWARTWYCPLSQKRNSSGSSWISRWPSLVLPILATRNATFPVSRSLIRTGTITLPSWRTRWKARAKRSPLDALAGEIGSGGVARWIGAGAGAGAGAGRGGAERGCAGAL
ncbi:hypothetical protein G6F57_018091 [Rhizopus arrhizus]|nr:hypothetical protein G6F57_018091 [Rhizopus arrhizus]